LPAPAPAAPATADRISLFQSLETQTSSPPAALWAFGLMILATAAQAIGRNKTRSGLTMLGVFIGVAALIAMASRRIDCAS
jgi:macrolide transport system ATP-binding/permease protein